MSSIGRILLIVLTGSMAGCADLVAPTRDTRAPVQTDTTSYLLVRDWVGWKTDIRVTWRNLSADTLYLVNCNGGTGLKLQKETGSSWSTFWTPVMLLCLSPPLRIAPGAIFADTVHIWGAEPGHNAAPEFPSRQVEGVFRLVWTEVVYHYTDRGSNFGDAVPLEFRYSNSFRLSQAR